MSEALRVPAIELEDIVGGLPRWITRVSAIHLLFLSVGLGSLLWFIEYPEVVRAPIAVTAEVPPAPVYSRFGTLDGHVAAVARSDADDRYVVTVAFPHGLVTSRGRALTLGQGMTGTADILTEDLRLAQRVFHQCGRFFTRDG